MSNQPPKEITTPPDGYEWTGEVRVPKDGEPYVAWSASTGGWEARTVTGWEWPEGILRKVKSPTVTVELPREWVTIAVKSPANMVYTPANVKDACRAALEREND